MKKDMHSLAHSVAAGFIRFMFPWVRFLEQDSIGDGEFQQMYRDECGCEEGQCDNPDPPKGD